MHIYNKKILFVLVGCIFAWLFTWLLAWCNLDIQKKSETLDSATGLVLIPENDFSQLDRTIVNQPISFEECTTRSGNKTYAYGDDPNYIICKVGKLSFSQFKNRPEPTGRDRYDFKVADSAKSVLEHSDLSISGQNSLIESFFLTGSQKKLFTGTIHQPDKDHILNKKMQFTLSGEENFSKLNITIQDGNLKILGKLKIPPVNTENIETYYIITENNTNSDRQEITALYIDENGEISWTDEGVNIKDNRRNIPQPAFKIVEKKIEKKRENGDRNETEAGTKILLEVKWEKISYQDIGKDPKYCFKNICLDPKEKSYIYKDWVMQEIPYKEGQENNPRTIYINTQEHIWVVIEDLNVAMGTKIVQENDDMEIYKAYTSWCGGDSITQSVQTKKELNLPNTLTIFWEEYTLQNLNFSSNLGGLIKGNSYWAIFTPEEIFADQISAETTLDMMIQTKKKIYNTYFIRFADYPQLYLQYTNTNIKNPEALFFSKKDIPTDKEWNIIDLDTTKEILCNLSHRTPQSDKWKEEFCKNNKEERNWWIHSTMFFDEEKRGNLDKTEAENSREQEIIFNEKVLPLYTIKKMKKNNRYGVYPAKGVEFSNEWRGCKPVIYLYDTHKRANQLSIQLPKYGSFTKLIPDFRNHNQDKLNTWDFTTDENSTIIVDGKTYPYLYYSTLRANYHNNQLARTVAYDDIAFFLNDKLDKMNFTATEKADFLEYWLPEFKPWYVYGISFKFNEAFSPYAQLTFKHKPTKSFRVFMEAHQYPISKKVNFNRANPDAGDSRILQSFDRGSDFDMLERWGNLTKLQ